MKQLFFLSFMLSFSILITSCGDDDNAMEEVDYQYHAHIHTPNTDDKKVGDDLDIDIEFESHSGEAVHHVNVRIYNKADSTEIYNQPDVAHVHETDGLFEFEDTFTLSNANGVVAHTDWILEAKVWGHEGRDGEVTETVEFHVHPE